MVNNGEASQAKQKQRWRSRANYSLTMAQPSPTQKPREAMATPFHNHAERWRSRVPRKTGLMNFTLRNLGVGSVKKGVLFERSEFHPL